MNKLTNLLVFILIASITIVIVFICYTIQQSKVNAMEMPATQWFSVPGGVYELDDEGIEKI